MSQPGKNPITRVNATDKPIATPRSAGTRTASRASSPASGSVTHMLIMMRRLYVDNELFQGKYMVEGRAISISNIHCPIFAVAAVADHVAPWHSVYKLHLQSDATELTFVLTSCGHRYAVCSRRLSASLQRWSPWRGGGTMEAMTYVLDGRVWTREERDA